VDLLAHTALVSFENGVMGHMTIEDVYTADGQLKAMSTRVCAQDFFKPRALVLARFQLGS